MNKVLEILGKNFENFWENSGLIEGFVVKTVIVHALQYFKRAKKGCHILVEQVMNDIPGSKRSWTIQEHCRYEKTPSQYSVNAHIACKVSNWWTSVVFTTKREDIQHERTYTIVYWNIKRLYFAFSCSVLKLLFTNRDQQREQSSWRRMQSWWS